MTVARTPAGRRLWTVTVSEIAGLIRDRWRSNSSGSCWRYAFPVPAGVEQSTPGINAALPDPEDVPAPRGAVGWSARDGFVPEAAGSDVEPADGVTLPGRCGPPHRAAHVQPRRADRRCPCVRALDIAARRPTFACITEHGCMRARPRASTYDYRKLRLS